MDLMLMTYFNSLRLGKILWINIWKSGNKKEMLLLKL